MKQLAFAAVGLALAFAIVLLATGCSRSNLVAVEELGTACLGEAAPEAAPYVGAFHPLVVLGALGKETRFTGYSVGDFVPGGDRDRLRVPPNTVQLVVCADRLESVDVSYCGIYRESTGVTGGLWLAKESWLFRVVVAATGTVIGEKIIDAKPSSHCPESLEMWQYTGQLLLGPPWRSESELYASDIKDYLSSLASFPLQTPKP